MLNINNLPGKLKHSEGEGAAWLIVFPGDCAGKYLSFPCFPAVAGAARAVKPCAVPTMPDRGLKAKREHEEFAACFGKRFLIKSVVSGQPR